MNTPLPFLHMSSKGKRTLGVRKLRFFLVFLLAGLLSPAFVPARETVRIVCDGDTVILESGERVRYLGIDTPEMGAEGRPAEFMAKEAKAFNARLVKGEQVRLEWDREKRDRYGRMLAGVYLSDGRLINELLVQHGLALVVTRRPNVLHRERLILAQREAMTRGQGIWSRWPDSWEGPCVVSRRSFRFHRPDCPYAQQIRPKNRVRFDSTLQACWEGYSPCSHCFPGP
jgi:micrococcal nuclease